MVFSTLPRPDYLKTPSHTYSNLCSWNTGTCTCTGTVYFGWGNGWWSKEVTGSVQCVKENFPDQKNPTGACKCFSKVVREYGETKEHPYVVGGESTIQSAETSSDSVLI